ncbi:hypothetical protein AM593_00204, partial [Mytilus galloprovincialis]
LGNDIVNIVKKVKEVEKVPIPVVEKFQQAAMINVDKMKVLLKVSESVGIFYGPRSTGTCWRVGKDTVMTAAHVVRDNIWSTFNQFLNEEKYKECYVDFNYNGQTKKDTDSKYVFDLERTAYFDETLDVAVVKLKRETHKEFPPPLEFFEVLDPKKNDNEHIYLIGHNKGNKLHINYGIGLWNPTEKRLTDLIKFCQEYGKENGYKELDRKDRLVIQCKFVSGASGCPGVIIRGDKASVVLIYTRGYPDFYFSKNFPEKDRQAFPDERLLQQGVNIGPVFESMTKKKMHLNLRNEIFPHQASEKQQQLNGQHQYAIDGAKKSNPESTFENVKNLEDHIIVRHVQDIENNTAKWTTCTEGHSETAIPDSAKYNRQPFYALAIDDRVDIAYPNMKPPADDTDITLPHGHSQNIPVHRNEQNITQ